MNFIQMQALNNITDILNNFLEPFECYAVPASDFAYYIASNRITYALAVSDKHEKTFMNFVHDLFPDIKADVFLWGFLHELGHHETEDDFEDDDWKFYYSKLRQKFDNDYDYYNLPIERAATEWAGRYMINHTKEIKSLWNKLVPAIKNFCKMMEVENDET